MLVLSRRNDQAVVIGRSDDFESILKVTVLGINGRTVKLGFEANKDVHVHREEVWQRIFAKGSLGPPNHDPDGTDLAGADGKTCVLSGIGEGPGLELVRP